jgi:hypothetical protein
LYFGTRAVFSSAPHRQPSGFSFTRKAFFVFLPGDKLNIPVAGKKWYDGMLLH